MSAFIDAKFIGYKNVKMPQRPPERGPIFESIVSGGGDKLRRFLQVSKLVDEKGRYLHWEQVRHRPPPEGFTAEEFWVAMRTARELVEQELPLHDKHQCSFRFCEPPDLRVSLRFLDMNAGGALGADGAGISAKEGKAHLTRSLAEEPFASSFIEGAATTRQIAKKLIFEGRKPVTRDERMVLNNYQAMEYVKERRSEKLDMAMLLELHRIVTEGTMDEPADAGRIRTSDDVQVVDDSSGEVLHDPPPASELGERLQGLFDFANSDGEGLEWVHPLLKAVIIHFMLAYEHPFVDGNGRVARALFYWHALRAGYWLLEYVSISSVIAEAKIRYGRSFLFVETDAADLTYFLVNQVQTLRKALDRLHAYVERKKEEVRALEERLTDLGRPDAFNHRQSWLLYEFVRGRLQRATIAEHEQKHSVSYLTARSDLEKLVTSGLLKKGKVAQTSIYRPVPNLLDRLTEKSGLLDQGR